MTRSENARKWLVQTAVSYLGTPYIWGGNNPSGFDCSGFVQECLRSVGALEEPIDCTADGLMLNLKGTVIEMPTVGALLFTLNLTGKATHVVICLDDWFCIGANGGTSETTDSQSAWRKNAFVKIRPIRLQSGRNRILLPDY